MLDILFKLPIAEWFLSTIQMQQVKYSLFTIQVTNHKNADDVLVWYHSFSGSETVRRRRRVKYDNGSRHARIMSIAHRKKASPNILVSGVEGRLLHNVFNHLVDAVVASQTGGMNIYYLIKIQLYLCWNL
jgi:hypothetical protein